MATATPSLLTALIAALDGPRPDACLVAALTVLHAHGIVEAPPLRAAETQIWLALRQGTRTLTLALERDALAPDEATRELIAKLLDLALLRAAESDELRYARERWDMLAMASFEGIMIHVDGTIIEVNQRMCELLGYERAELYSPEMLLRTIAPEDSALAQDLIHERAEGAFVVTLTRKDGSRFRAELHSKQSRFGKRPIRVVALRDVTERERTAALLRESEARLRQILEATFDSVVTSSHGVIVEVRSGKSDLLGRPPAELIGKDKLEIIAPSAREHLAARLLANAVGMTESTVLGPGGEEIPVEVVSVLSTLDGEPVRVAGLRDLRAARQLEHERSRLELQVERSQRLESLGVLASGIAHDFNNLLVGVLGSAELLAQGLTNPEHVALAENIRVAGESAAGLTRQMLAYAGRRDVHAAELIDLSELWREIRGLLDAALSKKARIELRLAPDCFTTGERSTLMQVMMNLLKNASDALEDQPGIISISTQHVSQPDGRWDEAFGATVGPGRWVMLQVRDNGVGMDLATQRRVFEPFFTTKAQGHGLGLGSCLSIVAAHGGAILVESAPFLGSTFSVLLPATDARGVAHAQHEPVARAHPASLRPHACDVLIVDDEPLVRLHLRRVLELRGFAVRDAPSAQAGLRELAERPPDVLLLDLSMPGMDGVELIWRLRASEGPGARVPVVLCSGNPDCAIERGLEPGAVQSVLQKPFSSDELLAAISRARELALCN